MGVQGHIKIKIIGTSTGRGDTSQSILEQIFNFSAPLEEILKLRREGLIKVVLPPVKPYFSSSYVERILSRLRGRCIRRDRIDKWADELGVNRTNFRRFISQYVAMGFATVRGFLICFSATAPALPVIVNNTEPSRAVGVRPGTVLSDDVIAVYYYLYRNNIRVLLAGRVPVRPEVWVATTLYASWYVESIRWVDKKKGSPVEREVDIQATVWVPDEESMRELSLNWETWANQFDDILHQVDRARELDYHLFFFELVGYGVLPLTMQEKLQMVDRPLLYDQAFLGLVLGPGSTEEYIVYLKEPVNAAESESPVVLRVKQA